MTRGEWAILIGAVLAAIVVAFVVAGWRGGLLAAIFGGVGAMGRSLRDNSAEDPDIMRPLREIVRSEEIARARTQTAEVQARSEAEETARHVEDTASGADRAATARRLRGLFFGDAADELDDEGA